ncbi:outer membrane protein transport protein [Oricola sp.]|uniref:outer membrane protein transport protein n=1 Tax=Oricola sp. TaxID=1979950 RepID=UPI0025DD57A5|nr:outer membrane protein transport protein [Oricola sp.]MCI5073805.1 outer membrane protein transport protein [Oricola sp.]
MRRGTKTITIGLFGATVLSSAALAGGFSRGSANLDGLYGDGFEFYSGVTFVSPGRSYENISGYSLEGFLDAPDQTFSNDYFIPYVSVGGKLAGNLNCVGSYTQPYGGDSEYSGAIQFDTAYQNFVVDELGLTCSVGFDAGPGRAYLIGGVFHESLDYNEAQDFQLYDGIPLPNPFFDDGVYGPNAGDVSSLNLTGESWGYRIGVGFEIPEIALRGSLMYRSQTDYDATGMYSSTPFATIAAHQIAGDPDSPFYGNYAGALGYVQGNLYQSQLSTTASASASLPQSVEFALRSGIRPGWLAFASVKWTDWSVLQQIQVVEGIAGQDFSSSSFFFKDGWTVTGGLAHQFNETLAGSFSVTWDKGVSGGYDTLTDTWTVASGVRYAKDNMTLSAGGAAIYLSEGQKTEGDYTAYSPGEWGYALSLSGSLKF